MVNSVVGILDTLMFCRGIQESHVVLIISC